MESNLKRHTDLRGCQNHWNKYAATAAANEKTVATPDEATAAAAVAEAAAAAATSCRQQGERENKSVRLSSPAPSPVSVRRARFTGYAVYLGFKRKKPERFVCAPWFCYCGKKTTTQETEEGGWDRAKVGGGGRGRGRS